MEMVSDSAEAQPHPELSGLVQKYVASALSGFAPGLHMGAPSPPLPLILTLRDHPVTVATTHHGNNAAKEFSSVLAGLQLSPVLIAHAASSHTLTIYFTPSGGALPAGCPGGCSGGPGCAGRRNPQGASVALRQLVRPEVRPGGTPFSR